MRKAPPAIRQLSTVHWRIWDESRFALTLTGLKQTFDYGLVPHEQVRKCWPCRLWEISLISQLLLNVNNCHQMPTKELWAFWLASQWLRVWLPPDHDQHKYLEFKDLRCCPTLFQPLLEDKTRRGSKIIRLSVDYNRVIQMNMKGAYQADVRQIRTAMSSVFMMHDFPKLRYR